ncbi:hypothetical protein F4680DRAFT_437557 [Xylaria scruposa]|nr:hypothetical protein F4680DRAFT_437557 [Xylaria scruposa]
MPPLLLEGGDTLNTKPIRPQPHRTDEPPVQYTPLPRKPPRKLNLDKCQHCREAKKKCEIDHLPQQFGCRRCVQRGLQCPGLTKAKEQTLILPNVIPAMNSQSSANTESLLKLNQLKAKSCFTCRALNLSCTSIDPGETPCQNCLCAGNSSILRSRLCMRATPFEDISIFLYCLPKAEVPRNDLDLNEISLDFDVIWTLPSIMSDVAEFLRPARQASTNPTSKVGMLCSLNFLGLIHKHIPHKAAWLFRSMLYGMSFSYAHPNHAMHTGGLSAPALQLLGAQAGHHILQYLDNELNPQQLSTFSIEKRQVLFLLVFGAILAIRYARKTDLSQELPTTRPMSEELWEMMRGHLCEMLAHHLVLLGTSVGVPLSKDEEERVLRLPAITWNRQGTHVWEVDENHSSHKSGNLKSHHLRTAELLSKESSRPRTTESPPKKSSRLRAVEKEEDYKIHGYGGYGLGGGFGGRLNAYSSDRAVWRKDYSPITTHDSKMHPFYCSFPSVVHFGSEGHSYPVYGQETFRSHQRSESSLSTHRLPPYLQESPYLRYDTDYIKRQFWESALERDFSEAMRRRERERESVTRRQPR